MTLLAALVLAPFTLLTLCFAVELFVGLRPIRGPIPPTTAGETVVILVPAHDEETVILDTLVALIKAAPDQARILVVADNCTDGTAEVARTLRVEVIERMEPECRGKGFALEFARTYLRQEPPDVVVVLDADCRIDGESLRNLVATSAATQRPCQAINLQFPGPLSSPTVQLSTFAFFIKNVVRQRALQRLAGQAHLLGTGMALPWRTFDRAAQRTDNIVEDLQMGIELAKSGYRPLFIEQSTVSSPPETETNTLAQRRRWEGGFLQNAVRLAPSVLIRSMRTGNVRGLWAGVNLFIPPLALLILLDFAVLLVGTIVTWLAPVDPWPVLLLTGSLLLACIGIALAWIAGGRRFVSIGGLARIPFYILWKLPMYIGFARRGAPKEWIRTR